MIIEEYVDKNREIEVPRDVIVDAIARLSGTRPVDWSDHQLVTEFRRLAYMLPATLDEIATELLKPDLDVEYRARLTWRRSEMERAEAKAKERKIVGDQLVFAPYDVSTLMLRSGRVFHCELVDGRQAFRMFLDDFMELAASRSKDTGGGQVWVDANPHLRKWL